MITLHPVTFEGDHTAIVYIAFTAQAAQDFIANSNNEHNNEYGEIYGCCDLPLYADEIPLVDNYGFPCQRSEASFIAPWLCHVSIEAIRFYCPEYQARKDREYIRQMSMGG